MRSLIALGLLMGLTAVVWGVVPAAVTATWGEEMRTAPDPAIWDPAYTYLDYTSRPGSWYSKDDPGDPGDYALSVRTVGQLVNYDPCPAPPTPCQHWINTFEPLADQANFTIEWRFRYDPEQTPVDVPGTESRRAYFSTAINCEQKGTQTFGWGAGQMYYYGDHWTLEMYTQSDLGQQNSYSGAFNGKYNEPYLAGQWYTCRVVCDSVAGTYYYYQKADGVEPQFRLIHNFAYLGPKRAWPSYNDQYLAIHEGELPSGVNAKQVEYDYLRTYHGALDPNTALTKAVVGLDIAPLALVAYENPLSGPTSGQYTVVLKRAPTANLTVAVGPEPADTGVSVAPASLLFTPGNWSTPQTVTVSVVNTSGKTTPSRVVQVQNHSSSADLVLDDELLIVNVTVYHDDVPAVVVDPGNGVAVAEQGTTQDTYTLQLLKAPVANVTVTPSADPAQLSITEANVSWTAANWYEKRTIQVAAVDDAVFETPNPYPVTLTHAASGAAGYAGLAVDSVTVQVSDNDCGTWGFSYYDKNQDCVVDLRDFSFFSLEWLKCTTPYGTFNGNPCYNALP